jgi:hypothetical protein
MELIRRGYRSLIEVSTDEINTVKASVKASVKINLELKEFLSEDLINCYSSK